MGLRFKTNRPFKQTDFNIMDYTLFFKEALPEQYHLLGGKGASLASMSLANLPVPVGFSITTHAYAAFLSEANLTSLIMDIVNTIDCTDIENLDKSSDEIRRLILEKPLPLQVEKASKNLTKNCAN